MTQPKPCFDTWACEKCGGIGQVANACFWCSTCNGTGTVPARLYCYEVWSPVISTVIPVCDDGSGPTEEGRDWSLEVAPNAKAAKWQAYRSKDFKSWRQEARDDGWHPLHGVTAKLARCDHGICWGCGYDDEDLTDDGISCSQCWAEADESGIVELCP